jgi:hypothetical protein
VHYNSAQISAVEILPASSVRKRPKTSNDLRVMLLNAKNLASCLAILATVLEC